MHQRDLGVIPVSFFCVFIEKIKVGVIMRACEDDVLAVDVFDVELEDTLERISH